VVAVRSFPYNGGEEISIAFVNVLLVKIASALPSRRAAAHRWQNDPASGVAQMLLAQVRWEEWLVPVAGLISAGVITFLGIRLLYKFQAERERARRQQARRERRAHRRSRPQVREVLVRAAGEETEPRTAAILDRSQGGVGIELKEKSAVGQRFQLRLRNWSPEAAWVNVEVRHCRPHGDSWRVGCQFLDVSTWEVIHLFGPPDQDEPA
jgi:hypothetical protein